jgi:hypothetical protein
MGVDQRDGVNAAFYQKKPHIAPQKEHSNGKNALKPIPGDANQAHHPAGKSPFYAVGEKAIRLAARALPSEKDCFFSDPRREQLPTVGLGQIQVHGGPHFAMAGRAGGQKKHGIFLPDRVGVVYLAEEFLGIDELGLELLP